MITWQLCMQSLCSIVLKSEVLTGGKNLLYEKISEDLQNEVIILTEKGDIYALNQEKCDDFEKKLIEREAEFDRSFSFDGGRLKKMILLLTEKCNLRCR